jgi:hypothetical protein
MAVWTADRGPRPATNSVARSHGASNGRVDLQLADGRLRLGENRSLSDPQSGCSLRQCIRWPSSLAWNSRSSHICTLTRAERVRRTVDQLDTAGMPRTYRGDRRAASAPLPSVLHGVLQCGAHAPVVREGCAQWKGHSAPRACRTLGLCLVGCTISMFGSNSR